MVVAQARKRIVVEIVTNITPENACVKGLEFIACGCSWSHAHTLHELIYAHTQHAPTHAHARLRFLSFSLFPSRAINETKIGTAHRSIRTAIANQSSLTRRPFLMQFWFYFCFSGLLGWQRWWPCHLSWPHSHFKDSLSWCFRSYRGTCVHNISVSAWSFPESFGGGVGVLYVADRVSLYLLGVENGALVPLRVSHVKF